MSRVSDMSPFPVMLLTGSRDAVGPQWDRVFRSALAETLNRLRRQCDPQGMFPTVAMFIHGAARGADQGAAKAAESLGVTYLSIESFPADWDQYGKAAGPRRNREMLARLQHMAEWECPCQVLAFHDDPNLGRGTRDMVNIALAAGFPVRHYRSDGTSCDLEPSK